MLAEPRTVFEFGPFRLDPNRQVLLREGQPVAVTPKAFEILLALIRRGSEVVTKEELMRDVWPDAFVEEANLTQNIFLLRKALGDSPEHHRYIVTVPGRGYRFTAPVRALRTEGETLVIENHTRAQIVVDESEDQSATTVNPSPDRLPSRVRWTVALPIAVSVLLVLAFASFLLYRRSPVALSAKDSVLVAEFTNSTGDPVFDGTLRQGLEVQLEQSPFLSLVSEGRIQGTLSLMGQPPDTRLTARTAREICERTGSAAVLEGSIASLGGQYVLGLRATNCRTGDLLDQEQVAAARKEDVLSALSHMASNFRTRAGESLTAVQQHETPLEQATTSSLEALKAYSMGWQAARSGRAAGALPFFKRAVEIDQNFAMAHAALALEYGTGADPTLATDSIRRAYELRDRASERERFFITAYYDGRATGNQEKAQQTCEAWARMYPREMLPHAFLAGFIYRVLGQYGKVAEEAQKVIELEPDNSLGYGFLGDAYVYLNRLPDTEEVLRRTAERKMQDPFLLLLRFHLFLLKNDQKGMEEVRGQAIGDSGAEDFVADHAAVALANSGRFREARRMSRHAAELAKQYAHPERAAMFETRAALWEAFAGNETAASRGALGALKLTRDREVDFGASVALAMAGDSSRSAALADDLEKHFPEDTSVRFFYLPAIRGLLAMRNGEPARAIELLQASVPYEFGVPRSGIQAYFGALYPVYVRGQAYLAARQGSEAAAEFQKILDHSGIVVGDVVGALARVGLARAYALSGDHAKAKAAYQEFFTLWKDADADIPILKQATTEYMKLP